MCGFVLNAKSNEDFFCWNLGLFKYSVVSSLVSLICRNLISGVNPFSTQVNLTRKVSI